MATERVLVVWPATVRGFGELKLKVGAIPIMDDAFHQYAWQPAGTSSKKSQACNSLRASSSPLANLTCIENARYAVGRDHGGERVRYKQRKGRRIVGDDGRQIGLGPAALL
jgi:hypothetical protein